MQVCYRAIQARLAEPTATTTYRRQTPVSVEEGVEPLGPTAAANGQNSWATALYDRHCLLQGPARVQVAFVLGSMWSGRGYDPSFRECDHLPVWRVVIGQDIEIVGYGCSQQSCRFRDERGIAHLLGQMLSRRLFCLLNRLSIDRVSFTQVLYAAEQGRE